MILRAEYLEIVQRIASGASLRSLIQSIKEKGVQPDEVPKLLSMSRVRLPSHQYKIVASVILREGLRNGGGENADVRMLAEMAPKTLPVFRVLADYITQRLKPDGIDDVRDMLSSNYTKRIWDRSIAEFLCKSKLSRLGHGALSKQRSVFIEESESVTDELELLRRTYGNLAKLVSGMNTHELASATLDLHRKGHLDVLVEMLRLGPEDPAIEQLIQGAEMRVDPVDPRHWVWIRLMLQRLREGKSVPNLKNYIISYMGAADMDNARLLFDIQQSGLTGWDSDWMRHMFRIWRTGV